MPNQTNNNIPIEVKRLRLCSSLQDCGGTVEACLKESDAKSMSIYDNEALGYTDWKCGDSGLPDTFIANNSDNKKLILLPLDNRIISGPKVKQGGVADCAVLTMDNMSFIEFKTNVKSNTDWNISKKTEDAINQLWHTFNEIIFPRCSAKGIDIAKMVDIEFYIVFNKELDVTSASASRLNYQMEFMNDHHFPLYFDNEKNF
jgi:hypothetical protein